MFSESVVVNVEDVHFILGARRSHLSDNEDYTWDIDARYDMDNPINNIAAMHDRIRSKEKKERDDEIRKEREER